MSLDTHKEFIQERRAYYKTLRPVFCQVLQAMVNFNSKGFYHLRYNGAGHERLKKEQIYRLNLLPLAVPVIKKAVSIFKYEERYLKQEGKYAKFWGLKASVGNNSPIVTVVLRKIGDGEITFYSIMKAREKNSVYEKNKKTAL
ncbi:MAG: hypothetical protein NTY12_02950 [Candidatus Falkowbacteria bacterium]|nr:hypothetical protein [Candidatus Falkowbacteria bacterium]